MYFMFWKRATGHGAFTGLLAGTGAAALHHGLTLPAGASAGVKGGWLPFPLAHVYPSEMAQNFYTAIYAFVACFLVTIAVSAMTMPRKDEELKGLVYSLTPQTSEARLAWYLRPATLGAVVLSVSVLLNVIFF